MANDIYAAANLPDSGRLGSPMGFDQGTSEG